MRSAFLIFWKILKGTLFCGKWVSIQGQEISAEVMGDCSDLNDRGGLSLLRRSTVCSVVVNVHPGAPQSHGTIGGRENFFVLVAVAEVASCDDT